MVSILPKHHNKVLLKQNRTQYLDTTSSLAKVIVKVMHYLYEFKVTQYLHMG